MATQLLLVDDDTELCALMREFFGSQGVEVEIVHDGRRGLARALDGPHDLVLLDVMLPGLDGFELLRQLRRRSTVPVIMLTARTAQTDRIAGLDAGADDYLPKPFGPEELMARIRAILRRFGNAQSARSEILEVNGIRLQPGTREVWADGVPVEITSIEYDILEFLVRGAGRIISRDQLMTVLHQRQATPFERSLDVHVSHLRKKLEAHRSLIRTVRGVGYLFRTDPSEEPVA
jgi:two-component system response regulator CpxR